MATNGYDEVSASNQESVSNDTDADRPGGSRDPQGPYNTKGKKLRIVRSVDPTIASKVKFKYTKKPPYKRD